MTLPLASLARLGLYGGAAAAQITLLSRAGQGAFAIMAALSWLGGGLLLLEREAEGAPPPPAAVPAPRFVAGLLLTVWSLLVLSRVARLYDPLLHLVPLAVLLGTALLSGIPLRSRFAADLTLLGALLPAQVLINRHLPTAGLAELTARVSAQILWLVGRPAFSSGPNIVLSDQVLVVDNSCTGVNTLTLCLATTVLLRLLFPFPDPRGRTPLAVGLQLALTLAAAFLVNAGRVALLGLTNRTAGAGPFGALQSFGFWHEGAGSHLFSLLAMTLVCAGYVAALELSLRHTRRAGP